MMVMVKAFGYGNGGLEIAKLLEHHKVDLVWLLPMRELRLKWWNYVTYYGT
jgi:alanine racemase